MPVGGGGGVLRMARCLAICALIVIAVTLNSGAQSQKNDADGQYQAVTSAPIAARPPVLSVPLTLPFQPVEFFADSQAYEPADQSGSGSQDKPIWGLVCSGIVGWLGRLIYDPLTVVTSILAYLTWCYVRNASRQTKAIAESVALARNEFNASHRPQLVIHSVRLLPPVDGEPLDDQPLRAEFAVTNAGTGDAWVTGSAVHLEYLFEQTHLPEAPENGVINQLHFGGNCSPTPSRTAGTGRFRCL